MDYNSTREPLILPEYGRNVQNMVDFIGTLKDREERNKYALAVIELMGHLNPQLRDVADFKHKLWDHLFIISKYTLDVDSPYPRPNPEEKARKHPPLAYPKSDIRYKHYGKTLELMTEKLKEENDPEKRQAFVQALANFMKTAYVSWNKDNVNDDTIISDLKTYLGKDVQVHEDISLHKVEAKNNSHSNNNRRKNKHNNGKKKKRY
jgi:hypothetical protein